MTKVENFEPLKKSVDNIKNTIDDLEKKVDDLEKKVGNSDQIEKTSDKLDHTVKSNDAPDPMQKTVERIKLIKKDCGELCDTTKKIEPGDFMGSVTAKVSISCRLFNGDKNALKTKQDDYSYATIM